MRKLVAGIRSDVVVPFYGNDRGMLPQKADEIVRAFPKGKALPITFA